jgi:hypothetical protein
MLRPAALTQVKQALYLVFRRIVVCFTFLQIRCIKLFSGFRSNLSHQVVSVGVAQRSDRFFCFTPWVFVKQCQAIA